MIITVVFSPMQDDRNGNIVVDNISKRLDTYLFLSDQFNLAVPSELKRVLNNIRYELYQQYITTYNDELPKGAKQFSVGTPRTCKLKELNNKIVNVVNIDVTIKDDEMRYDHGYNLSLLDADINSYRVDNSSQLCEIGKPVELWKQCNYGQKNRDSLTGSIIEQLRSL